MLIIFIKWFIPAFIRNRGGRLPLIYKTVRLAACYVVFMIAGYEAFLSSQGVQGHQGGLPGLGAFTLPPNTVWTILENTLATLPENIRKTSKQVCVN